MTLQDRFASRIIVDCGYNSEFPCPHAHPTMGYEKCPHLDKDICMWQREQTKGFLSLVREEIEKCLLSDSEQDDCTPTKEEIEAFLAEPTPPDELNQFLENYLSSEIKRDVARSVVLGRKVAKAQLQTILKALGG